MKSDPLAKSMKTLERVKGIEPSYSAWKAAALPLSYTRASDDPLTRSEPGLNHRPRGTKSGQKPPPLTDGDSRPILMFQPTTKGGDPVSYTKRCHLAGIAR